MGTFCRELCRNGWTIDLPLGLWTRVGRRKHEFNHVCQVAPVCTISIVFASWHEYTQWQSAMSWAKMAEPINLLFGLWTWVGQKKHKFKRVQKGTLAPPGKYDWTIHLQRRCRLMSYYVDHSLIVVIACTALTLLIGHQQWHPACKNSLTHSSRESFSSLICCELWLAKQSRVYFVVVVVIVVAVGTVTNWLNLALAIFTQRRSFAEYWKYFVAHFNNVHVFGYNSTGSERIWMKFGELQVYCLKLALTDFGHDPCRSESRRPCGSFVFCQVNNAQLCRFPVSQISRNFHTRRGSVMWWIF